MSRQHIIRMAFALFCLGLIIITGITSGLFKSVYTYAVMDENYELLINEIMASNSCVQADDGGYHGYIELYNASDHEINLKGFGLSSNIRRPYMWVFPDFYIQPRGYAVVWVSGKAAMYSEHNVHAGFQLKAGNNAVILTSPGHSWRTVMLYGDMPKDISFGRKPDGGDSLYWFDGGTPGGQNSLEPLEDGKHRQRLAPVQFSMPAGFYESEIYLELSHNDEHAHIYYTLDGSEPGEDALLYEAPIQLGTKDEPAVIRARAFKPGYPKSEVVTRTYFVQQGIMQQYDIPIVSLVTDPDNLFDYEKGIYVKGKTYDEWVKAHDESQIAHGIPANYNQEGKRWERDAHLELFDPSGAAVISQNIGVRTHGGYSLDYQNKSLSLLADPDYDEATQFEYDFFKEGAGYIPLAGIILRNSASDAKYSFFRDAFMQSLADPHKLDIQKSQPCIAFINGEYYGIYNIRPLYGGDYIAKKYNFDAADVVIIKNPSGGIGDQIQEGITGDETHYNQLYNFIKDYDIEKTENYAYVETLMDIDNYIEYNILEIYCGNRDWIANNVRVWRKRTPKYEPQAPYGQDGRWRWLVFDLDAGYGLYGKSYTDDMLAHATAAQSEEWFNPSELTIMLRKLLTNEEFKNKFITRFADLLNSNYSEKQALTKLNDMVEIYLPYVQRHINRWGLYKGDIGRYMREINNMRIYAKLRPSFVRRHIQSYFGLTDPKRLDLSISGEGSITVNTISIGAYDVPWTGYYFKEIPVVLRAVPAEGYRFEGWTGTLESENEILKLNLSFSMQLQACFVKTE